MKNLPRTIALVLAIVIALWAVKSCVSPYAIHDQDRTGIKGMPY